MISLRKLNRCDIFVFIWGLYFLQDILYSQGIINQVLQLLMIVMGLLSFVSCLIKLSNPSLIKATIFLLTMFTLYGIIDVCFGGGSTNYLKTSLNSLLPILFFYQQAKDKRLTEDRIKIYFFIILTIVLIQFTHTEKMHLIEFGEEDNTNNVAYRIVAILPFIFLFGKRPIFQYLILAILMIYILIGMKRGAILIGGIVSLLVLYSSIREQRNVKKFFVICVSFLLIIGVGYYFDYLLNSSENFYQRIQSTIEGESSGRNEIYSIIWNVVKGEQNLFRILFGHGADSTIEFAGIYAHNDWLETICNNGIFGVCILLYFIFSLAMTLQSGMKKLPGRYYYSFLALFIIILLKTLFSMSIQNFDMCQALLIGFFTYKIDSQQKQSCRIL